MRARLMMTFIALFALFAASPQIGRWVSTANASSGPVTAGLEVVNAPANDNDDDPCNSRNPRKQKKCHYNSPNVDNDNEDGNGDHPPVLAISVSNADPEEGESFSLTLHAWGNDIDHVWWWVPDVVSDNGNDNDSALAQPHTLFCDWEDDCTRTTDLTSHNPGTITIHARARDRFGRESEEAVTEVRVHDD